MEQEPKKKPFWIDVVVAFGKITGWIVAPIVMAAFIGGRYDEARGTGNTYFMIAAGIAMIITIAGIASEARRYSKMMDKQEQKDTTRNDN